MNADLRTVSICTGIGGLELGIKTVAKTRTVMYVENELTAIQILVKRMEEGSLEVAPIWSDLKTFRGADLYGRVDLLIGGFPCQPFSTAGKRKGAEDERNLWPEVRRIAEELGHPTLFLENVNSITEYYHDTIRPELQAMGYRTTEGLFSAREAGLPHRRQRLLMLACVSDTDYLEPYLLPNPNNTGDSTLGHRAEQDGVETYDKRQTSFLLPQPTGQSEVVEDGIGIGCEGGQRRLYEKGIEGEESENKIIPTSNSQCNGEEGVAYTNGIGHICGESEVITTEEGIVALSNSADCGEVLAYCTCERLEGSESEGQQEHAPGRGYKIRFAPPTIDDDLGWAYTLAHMPEIEPSICRVVDGLPVGMEQRLRTLGNGVVPSMAAKGFTELVKKLQTSKNSF